MEKIFSDIKKYLFLYIALITIILSWTVTSLWELHWIERPNWVYLQYNRTIGIGMLIISIYSLHKKDVQNESN